ncbi:Protein LAZY 1 [Rhynchospora pubera]|uniref:Protein LAZY 1 n=1 Tax=Rhynchospora pubera TaxID=906938 RepID=A0AAV8FVK3_9POAL|nr:Protein LAZY 1 [Rhynchospora pubera]
MKLLGWMHRKFRQNSSDVFSGGGTCTCLAARPSLDEAPSHHEFNTFLSLSAATFPPPPDNTDISSVTPDLFSSTLLSIGTFGLFPHSFDEEQYDTTAGTETPTFGLLEPLQTTEPEASEEKLEAGEEKEVAAMVEAIAEKAAEATTESDLMAVTAELEKALAAVAAAEEKEGSEKRVSSARPSSGMSTCPLQGFLFGSPMVDLTAREGEGGKEKRASLGELFMRSRMAELAEEAGEGPDESGEMGEDKWTARIGLKKMIRLSLRGGSRGSGGSADTNNKLQKILQMFHRKVYPETAATRKNKWAGTRTKKRETSKDQNRSVSKKKSEETECCIANRDISRDANRNVRIPNFNCCSARSFVELDDHRGSLDSSVNREHWIKTDADCKLCSWINFSI